jgi:hypothetical protein
VSIAKKVILLTLYSILSVLLADCGQQEPYLIGTIEDVVSREEMILSVEKNQSKISETDRVILTQKKLMDFTYFKKGTKVKVWIYDGEVRPSVPPKVPLKKIEVIE